MKLSTATIFYWFHRRFPGAIHLNPADSAPVYAEAPLFYEGTQDVTGHFVVVMPDHIDHFVHHCGSAIPVFVGCPVDRVSRYSGEAIVLEDNVSLGTVFNALQEVFQKFHRWEQQLREAVDRYFSFDAIIRSCDDLLEDPLALADNQFRYVSYSKQLAFQNGYEEKYVDGGRYLPLEYINQLTAMPDFKESETYTGIYQYVCVDNMMHKNIFYQGEFVGRLALPYPKEPCKVRYYRHMLLRIAEYVELLYQNMGSFWHRESANTRLGSLLQQMLNGQPVEMDVLRRTLINQGCRNDDQFQLIQIKSHFTSNEEKLTSALTTQLEKMWPGTCCFAYRQRMIVFRNISLYRRSTDKLFNQELAVFLRESLLLAGVSRSFQDIHHIQAAYQQTEIALDAGSQLTPTYWYFKYDDYAYWDLLHHGCRNFLPEQICHLAINLLTAYDRKNNTELNRTLKVYIANQYNAVSTSAELCIARSTFLKRLARITELTDLDLGDLKQRVYLALSYELFEQYDALNHTIPNNPK